MKSNAFTLIELVVVIVILGILAAIAIPKYIDITDKARLAADRSQLGALRAATHMLYAQNILNADGGAASNQPVFPTEAAVYSNLTRVNPWQSAIFTAPSNHVLYNQSNGLWGVYNVQYDTNNMPTNAIDLSE